jgi:hypothetical protein
VPSRLNVQNGTEAPFDPVSQEWCDDVADQNIRVRKILDRLKGSDGGTQ